MRLENKIAVVTGASRGIGKAIAAGFVKEGATVVIASRKQEALDEAANELRQNGGTVAAIATHTGYEDQCQALIDQTVERFGRVDIMVNNAATNPHFGSLLDAEPSQWQKTFEVNIMGYFWLCKYAALNMQTHGGGKIINMASVVGFQPGFMMGVYSVSKAAVIMLTKALAQELGSDNIQVNAIAPGIIKTRFAAALWDNEAILQRHEERTPLGRIGQPEEISEAAIFLASQGANYLTGHVMVIDGGTTITNM